MPRTLKRSKTYVTKKFSTHRHRLRIFDPHFWVYTSMLSFVDEDVNDNGGMTLKYQIDGDRVQTIELPLYSCWIVKTYDGDRVCKAHAIIRQDDITEESVRATELAQMIYENTMVEIGMSNPMKIIADKDCQLLMYLPAENDGVYKAQDEEYHKLPVYNTKAEAINATLNALESFHKSRITGIDFANLNSVSNELMSELRFTEVKDACCHGPSMWAGDPHQLLTGRRRYSSNWGSSYSNDDDVDDMTDEDLAASFVDILEIELG